MEQIRADMTDYAIAVAGTTDDFGPEIEAWGLEVWENSDE